MKAAVCRAFGAPLLIEDVEIADPGPGEVRVRMGATAICHSDITYAEGGWGGALPAVYGHEGAGTVVAVGDGVHTVATGDRVVVTLIRSCGRCHGCVTGLPVACESRFPLDERTPLSSPSGEPIAQALRTGAFAEHAVVHQSQVVAVPGDLPLDVASLLACGVITGFGAVTNTARMRPGGHVVVIGTGGVGLNSVQGAVIGGARTITAVDLSRAKLEAALAFGATHAIDAASDDVAARVREITGGHGADYVFVTVGAKAAFDQSYALLARRGTVVLVGMPPTGVLSQIDPGTLADLSQSIIGSKMGSARISVDVPFLVDLYRQGRLKLDELISGRYPLEQINEAIAAVTQGDALRNVIVFAD